MKHLPDDQYIQESREKVNNGLMKLLDKYPDFVDSVASYHIAIDKHILLLNELLFEYMQKSDKMKALYDDLLEQYGEMSDREIKMMEWIIKRRNEQLRAKEASTAKDN